MVYLKGPRLENISKIGRVQVPQILGLFGISVYLLYYKVVGSTHIGGNCRPFHLINVKSIPPEEVHVSTINTAIVA